MTRRVPLRPAAAAAATVLAAAAAVLTACQQQVTGKVSPPASPSPVNGTQASAALITTSDLPTPWRQTGGGAASDDTLRGASTDRAECQQLLTGLGSGNVLDQDPLAHADRQFAAGQSALAYRVGSYTPTAASDGLALIKRLPRDCARFTATLSDGTAAIVQVVALAMPDVGDERAGLTATVGTTANGLPATYTTDVAAARFGPNAFSLSNGGLGGADHTATEQAVESGAQRLSEVLLGKTPAPLPSVIG